MTHKGWCVLKHQTNKQTNKIRTHKMLGLIWTQTVWHSDGISERIFRKSGIRKKSAEGKSHEKLPSMQRVKNGKPPIICGRLKICGFVCETISCAKSSLHWSVSTIRWLLLTIWVWFGNVYCCLLCHLVMYLGSLYCNQYECRSDWSLRGYHYREHTCFFMH